MTIFPSVVHSDPVPLLALSAEIFVPPVAAVTVTAAYTIVVPARRIQTKNAMRQTNCIAFCIGNRVVFSRASQPSGAYCQGDLYRLIIIYPVSPGMFGIPPPPHIIPASCDGSKPRISFVFSCATS